MEIAKHLSLTMSPSPKLPTSMSEARGRKGRSLVPSICLDSDLTKNYFLQNFLLHFTYTVY